jgi:hypothetical protein
MLKKICRLVLVFIISFPLLVSAQEQNELLNEACNQKSDSLLNKFFVQWYKESKPSTLNQNSIEKEATILFQLIYDPLQVSKICGYSTWDSLYSKSEYIAVQNDLKINILQSDSLKRQKTLQDSIIKTINVSDFRPKLEINGIKTLYLTKKYNEMLKNSLGNPAKISIKNQQKTGSECESKQAFLRKYIMVIQSKNSKEWYIESHPYITYINFSKNMRMARIDFRMVYQNGTAYFIKDRNEWRMIWSGLQQNN